jgi:hypothetical protein
MTDLIRPVGVRVARETVPRFRHSAVIEAWMQSYHQFTCGDAKHDYVRLSRSHVAAGDSGSLAYRARYQR